MFKVLSQTKQLKLLAVAFLLQSLPASSDILSDTPSDNINLTPIITVKEQPKEEPEKSPPSPGLSFGVPSAFGASNNSVFVGLSYGASVNDGLFTFYNSANKKVADGSMNFGIGLGDASDLAAEVSVGIISMTCQKGKSCFAADGTMGLKLHKRFDNTFIDGFALGYSDLVRWGEASDFATIYVAASKDISVVDKEALFTVGIGTGGFRSQSDVDSNKNNPNLFTGIGVKLAPRLSLSSSWNGSTLNAGFGISPFDFPLSVSTGVTDITDVKREGMRYSINFGYSFSF